MASAPIPDLVRLACLGTAAGARRQRSEQAEKATWVTQLNGLKARTEVAEEAAQERLAGLERATGNWRWYEARPRSA